MKIRTDSNSLYYTNPYKNVNRQLNDADYNSSIKNFDEIFIHKSQAVPENKFISEVKNKIMNDIKSLHSEKEIEELKLQVEDGSYQIGFDEIIRKILL